MIAVVIKAIQRPAFSLYFFFKHFDKTPALNNDKIIIKISIIRTLAVVSIDTKHKTIASQIAKIIQIKKVEADFLKKTVNLEIRQ